MLAVIGRDLWVVGEPIAEKVIRTVAVYGGILLLLRLAGKRELAQLNTFDLTVLLLLSNVVQNAIIGNDNSLVGGLIGAAVLLLANSALVRLARRSETAVRVFEGNKTVLMRDGKVDDRTLHRLGIRKSDVLAAVRRQGANTPEEVKQAVLQPGGVILVTLRPEDENATRRDIERLEAKLDQLLTTR